MNTVAGCRVDRTLHEDSKTGIYRGWRVDGAGNEHSVIVKTLRASYPLLEDVAQLRREFEIARTLPLPGVVQPLDLIDHDNSIALVLEDFGAISLHDFLAENSTNGLELDDFFFIALSLATTLGQIHERGVIHKDLKPDNILINAETKEVKIGDFGIAIERDQKNLSTDSSQHMQGTLAYMSPEQTGRMNQPVDHRTDFYSLGVTFYEMLTGRLPFEASDAMEIVHCHLALTPPAPQQIRNGLPAALSNLVLKLLAKTAPERYQSARGLVADLQECHSQWQSKRNIEDFVLGRHDGSSELCISRRIYGRENEIAVLLEAFNRAANGAREMVTIAGYSGIGKTSVVQEIHKSIAQQRGFFVSGKFDQFRRDVPYATLIQAFRELIRQVLTESEARLAHFKARLLEAFGPNGQLLIEVIPEIELIVGPQPAVPVLGPQEALNRFNFVSGQFVRVWSQPEHPLVLFLDDLQWADAASLKFLGSLMSDEQCRHLLVIGAYRDNEVTSSHPFVLTLDAIRKAGGALQDITLGPLGEESVCELLEDSLRCSRSDSRPLADLLLRRTEGNPFFLGQLLKSLHDEKLIFCEGDKWRWDLEAIGRANLTGNVVELMAGKIKKLPFATQEALKLAACIGNRFDSRTLALVRESSITHMGADLWDALREGLITPLASPRQVSHSAKETLGDENLVTYKFLHDRVQQAAYSLVRESERPALHLKIGRLLLEHSTEAERDEKLFEITSHLNHARELITRGDERHRLVRLNLQAGLKAKSSAAHGAAATYFALGQAVATEDLWKSDYATMFQLAHERSQSEYLEGHFDQAETQFEIALSRAQTVLDRAAIERIRIQLYITRCQYVAALKIGLDMLRAMGLVLNPQPSQRELLQEIARAKWQMRGRKIADLQSAPRLTNAHQETILSLLSTLGAAAYLAAEHTLFSVMALKSVNITLRYGTSDYAPQAFAFYGLLLGSGLGAYKSGDEWGQLSLQLADATENARVKCVPYFAYPTYLSHWRRPLGEAEEFLWQAYQFGLEAGDTVYAGYSVVSAVLQRAMNGVSLGEQLETIEKYSGFLHWTKEANQLAITQLVRQFCLNLQGHTDSHFLLDGGGFEEKRVLSEVWSDKNSGTGRCAYSIIKLRLFYLRGDYHAALEMAQEAQRLISALLGQSIVCEANFFHSLTLAALHPQAAEREKHAYWKQLRKNQRQMKKWAANAPENHAHKQLLVEAEMARLAGHDAEAAAFYDRSIRAAHEAGVTQNEALANEIAARFYGNGGRTKLARAYLDEALYLYEKWGAHSKRSALETEGASILGGSSVTLPSEPVTTTPLPAALPLFDFRRTTDSSGKDKTSALDLATVVKAAQALSGEIDLGRLLQQLLRFALENAGATRGALILRQDEQLCVQAIGVIGESEVTLPARRLEDCGDDLPLSIIQYVARTKENVVLGDATREDLFNSDSYLATRRPRSVLCAPIVHQAKLNGLIYLENHLAPHAFTPERLEVLGVLSAQAAISLQNARLYGQLEDYSHTLEQRVEERTEELRAKNSQLEQTLRELQEMQNRVIVQEKMASLGALTAGIAHEIKNPLNFINNFASLSVDLAEELDGEMEKFKANLDNETREYMEEVLADLKINAQKIHEHGNRADSIVRGMLLHSRGQKGEPEFTDLNALVREAVHLAYHGQRAHDQSFSIALEEEYDPNVGQVRILSHEISRVVLNLANNAFYAANQKARRLNQGTNNADAPFLPTLRVTTKALGENIEIRVRDNGDGISEAASQKIFTPFFTSKPTGQGTGLGLSMSYDIVVQQHGGDLRFHSQPKEWTEFVVSLPNPKNPSY
ncbi:MAG TPA: AAA family ATPase [Abditibacterium sp.]|jgi:predicted ATPase/signal transduction histidine kinase